MDYRQPDLSVITVNYNGFHDTCEFIDSWAATVFSVSYEMIVIDNGSTANEAALLQKTYPFIQAVRSERNLGFADGKGNEQKHGGQGNGKQHDCCPQFPFF